MNIRNTLLEKYGNKIKFTKEPALIGAEKFESIVIIEEFGASTLKAITRASFIKRPGKNGEETREYDNVENQMAMVQHCVEFDGKKLTRAEITRLESSFFNDLVLMLTLSEESTQSEGEISDD